MTTENTAPVEAGGETGGDDGGGMPEDKGSFFHDPPKEEKLSEPIVVQRPLSRRQQVEQERNKEVAELREQFTDYRKQFDEIKGMLRQPPPQYAPPPQQYMPPPQMQQPAAQMPDPARLHAEAMELLRKEDVAGAFGKISEAAAVQAEQRTQKMIEERLSQQRPAAPQLPPDTMMRVLQFPTVAQHPAGLSIAAEEDNRLARLGYPPGPAREMKALELASNWIAANLPQQNGQGVYTPAAQPPGRTGPDPATAAAHSAVPTARGQAAGGGAPRVRLTSEERDVARGMGWSEAFMAAEVLRLNPGRAER